MGAECEYSLWTEDKNAHLWYLNEYEHCGEDTYGRHAHHESVSLGAPQSDNNNQADASSDNLNVYNSHWFFSLICILIGFGAALIYYACIKCIKDAMDTRV